MERYKAEVAAQNAINHEPPSNTDDNWHKVGTRSDKHAKVAAERQMDQESPSVKMDHNFDSQVSWRGRILEDDYSRWIKCNGDGEWR